jgi:hypothetical protein
MAFKDKDLLKPSVYALVVGMIVSVIGIIPLAIAYGSSLGNFVLAIMGGILIFVQFVVTYIFSGMTVYLIYGYLSEGDGRMDKAWAIVKRDFFDILTLAAVSTVVNMLKSAAQRNRKNSIVSGLMRSATGLLETLWTEAAYLILPAMVIDDLNLKDSMQRIWKITKENLLLVGISTVGVRWVTGLISFLFSATGLVLGFVIGGGLSIITGSTAISVVGIVIGAFIFFAFAMVASIFSSYTNTAYHTCLYIWAREVETAKAQGSSVPVLAPAPLAAALA